MRTLLWHYLKVLPAFIVPVFPPVTQYIVWDSLGWFAEFAIHKLLVKNRIEQWRVLIDLDQCSALSAPVGILKDIADALTVRRRLTFFSVFSHTYFSYVDSSAQFPASDATSSNVSASPCGTGTSAHRG